MTRSEPADDEPTPPRDRSSHGDEPIPADDSPTTELSATDPEATQDWPAPGAGPEDGTREHAALGDDAAREQTTPVDDAEGDAPGEYSAVDDDAPVAPVDEAAPTPPAAAPDREALRDWSAGDTRETRIVSQAGRDRAPEPLPDSEFPVVWRGYDVHAVDAYVTAAEDAIASYEERTLPTVAVQRALDRVGEQTASILREAEQAAEETARVSRAQADDRLQRAEREAAEVIEAAERRVRDLDDDIERLWQERQRLIDATRDIADRLRMAADNAESRFPPAAPSDAPPSPFAGPVDETSSADDGVPLGERDVEPGADDEPGPPVPGDEPGPRTV